MTEAVVGKKKEKSLVIFAGDFLPARCGPKKSLASSQSLLCAWRTHVVALQLPEPQSDPCCPRSLQPPVSIGTPVVPSRSGRTGDPPCSVLTGAPPRSGTFSTYFPCCRSAPAHPSGSSSEAPLLPSQAELGSLHIAAVVTSPTTSGRGARYGLVVTLIFPVCSAHSTTETHDPPRPLGSSVLK